MWACSGQLQDPDEQGIAHMMEHVCFLGSRKRCGLWVLVANVRVQLILSADDCRRFLILGWATTLQFWFYCEKM